MGNLGPIILPFALLMHHTWHDLFLCRAITPHFVRHDDPWRVAHAF